jgi:hypothetical protein
LQDDKEAQSPAELGGRRGRDRMIVVFTTTCQLQSSKNQSKTRLDVLYSIIIFIYIIVSINI